MADLKGVEIAFTLESLSKFSPEEMEFVYLRTEGLEGKARSRELARAIEIVENRGKAALYYDKLIKKIAAQLKERLRKDGMSRAEAASIVHAVMGDFQASANSSIDFSDFAPENLAVNLVVSAIRATRAASQFGEAAKLALPERAPEIWAERDRSRGETPIEFLNRVWGRWMEAGVLYQNDIKRLGDPTLVKTIRTYCHRQGVDASTVLPPPQSARLERALAQAEPGSPLETLIRERLRGRDRAARHHRKPKVL